MANNFAGASRIMWIRCMTLASGISLIAACALPLSPWRVPMCGFGLCGFGLGCIVVGLFTRRVLCSAITTVSAVAVVIVERPGTERLAFLTMALACYLVATDPSGDHDRTYWLAVALRGGGSVSLAGITLPRLVVPHHGSLVLSAAGAVAAVVAVAATLPHPTGRGVGAEEQRKERQR